MRNRSEIREVFTQGRFRPLGPIGAKYLRTSHPECRFLVTVKKNVGDAPVRNRIKRLLREGFPIAEVFRQRAFLFRRWGNLL